jgi:hypothetical protein
MSTLKAIDVCKVRPLTTVEQLYKGKCSDVPAKPGVYFVCVHSNFEVEFTETTTAISEHDGQNLLYPKEALTQAFAKTDKQILYIGTAGASLQRRIKQLVQYGYGEGNNHQGGRALWQIRDNRKLLVGYIVCDQAGVAEAQLLHEYRDKYGVLPVANRQLPAL